jgi:serpin B
MAYVGARGETASDYVNALRLGEIDGDETKAFRNLLRELDSVNEDVVVEHEADPPVSPPTAQLHLANRIWGQFGRPFNGAALDILKRHFDGAFETINFANVSVATETINAWISEHTRGMITNLITYRDLVPPPEMVLANATYFNGTWLVTFPPERTMQGVFRTGSNRPAMGPMMSTVGSFDYYSNDQLEVLELPYTNTELTMTVILPRQGLPLSKAVRQLTPESLDVWDDEAEVVRVNVTLPRFDVRVRYPNLDDALAEMGMIHAFGPGGNYSGFGEGITLDRVIHEAVVEVTETGTEAAAVTVMTKRGAPPVEFKADRPFVFLIRHRATDTILFAGRVVNPFEM